MKRRRNVLLTAAVLLLIPLGGCYSAGATNPVQAIGMEIGGAIEFVSSDLLGGRLLARNVAADIRSENQPAVATVEAEHN